MASKEDVAALKRSLQELRRGQLDILIRLENMEDRLAVLEGGSGDSVKLPDPILTCVQCEAEYKDSENAEGGCKYHSRELHGAGWNFTYSCCGKSSNSYDSAKLLAGCTKGKHCSKHHTDYVYSTYFFYMIEQSNKAKEIWMTIDADDHVTERVEWAEVGLSAEGNVYILVGKSRIDMIAFVEFSADELKCCLSPCITALEKTDSVGWAIKAEINSNEGVANAITVSVKPASSDTATVKRVTIVLDGDDSIPQCGSVQCISNNGYSCKQGGGYSVPEEVHTGPVLEAGDDYSKDRKNDYESETSDCCPLKLAQVGHTEVASSNRQRNDKWNNLFSVKVNVTNTAQENTAYTEIQGDYMNHEGEWVKCDQVFMGTEAWRGVDWSESTNSSMEAASTGTIHVRLCIQFDDVAPSSNYDGRRAHFSLPQPLHLRATFVDQQRRKSTLRFEQGNSPLPLATRKTREDSWAKKCPLLFHLTADDVTLKKRSDAALYYDEKGILCYRPAPNDNASQIFYIARKLSGAAYKAVRAGEEVYEFTDMVKESKGSSVHIYALVDLKTGLPYAIKISIVTPTSSAAGYWLVPDEEDAASITVEPDEVRAREEFTLKWTLRRVSKNDRIAIYPHLGKTNTGRAIYNKEEKLCGSAKLQAPDVPGKYEVRYCPAWLQSQNTGFRHDIYWVTPVFTVKAA